MELVKLKNGKYGIGLDWEDSAFAKNAMAEYIDSLNRQIIRETAMLTRGVVERVGISGIMDKVDDSVRACKTILRRLEKWYDDFENVDAEIIQRIKTNRSK